MPDDSETSPPVDEEERRSLFNRLTAFETTLVAGGVILFIGLLLEMRSFLNPPLLAFVGALLLWPLREHRAVRALLISGALLVALWVLNSLSTVLIPFVVAYLLAFLLNPAVSYAKEKYGLSRWTSSFGATFTTLGALAGLLVVLVPNILSQIQRLGTRAVEIMQLFRGWLTSSSTLDMLAQMGLIESREATVEQINNLLKSQAGAFTSRLPELMQQVLASLDSVLSVLTLLSIVPVATFYTLKDYPFIKQRLVELFPTFGGRRDYLVEAGSVVGSYMRGMLIVMLIAGAHVSFWFVVLDVPLGLLLGVIAGLLNIIPNLGAILTNIVALLVVSIFGDPWLIDAAKVLIVIFGQGLLEQAVITPNVLSHQVGLHPVLILLALFTFGYFMGIFGFLIAVPATALIMTIYKAYRDEWSFDIYHYTTAPSPGQLPLGPLRNLAGDADDDGPSSETSKREQQSEDTS